MKRPFERHIENLANRMEYLKTTKKELMRISSLYDKQLMV